MANVVSIFKGGRRDDFEEGPPFGVVGVRVVLTVVLGVGMVEAVTPEVDEGSGGTGLSSFFVGKVLKDWGVNFFLILMLG